jgi:hypothetical protein
MMSQGVVAAQDPFERLADHVNRRRRRSGRRCPAAASATGRAVDQGDRRGAAGQRLEAQGAAAGIQIQAAAVGDVVAQPVEQRFAHPA